MRDRFIAALAVCALSAWPAARAEPTKEPPMAQPHTAAHPRTHAVATIAVESQQATPFDQAGGPALLALSLTERFTGDIEAQSTVRALEIQRADKSAILVSLQRVRGAIGNRRGDFVLEGREVVEHGHIHATWSVVPGSGTGELVGLRGEGGFEGEFGKGSRGTLDYWFE